MKDKQATRHVDREGSKRARQQTRAQARAVKELTIRQGDRAFRVLIAEGGVR